MTQQVELSYRERALWWIFLFQLSNFSWPRDLSNQILIWCISRPKGPLFFSILMGKRSIISILSTREAIVETTPTRRESDRASCYFRDDRSDAALWRWSNSWIGEVHSNCVWWSPSRRCRPPSSPSWVRSARRSWWLPGWKWSRASPKGRSTPPAHPSFWKPARWRKRLRPNWARRSFDRSASSTPLPFCKHFSMTRSHSWRRTCKHLRLSQHWLDPRECPLGGGGHRGARKWSESRDSSSSELSLGLYEKAQAYEIFHEQQRAEQFESSQRWK